MRRIAVAVAAAVASAGCSPVMPTNTGGATPNTVHPHPVPPRAAPADPQQTTWQAKVSQLDAAHYRIDLLMSPLSIGGVGEAEIVFRRQAEAIATRIHSAGYAVLSWNEGIDSQFPIARRWASGVIQVQPAVATSSRP
ncbi:MAG TPA: hypothetical protein VMH32_20235 [Burkholderiales bacterium]|nr:hypothetical protein [Burkholderiales bacterium]